MAYDTMIRRAGQTADAVFAAADKKAALKGGTLRALVQFPHPADHYLFQALVEFTTDNKWVVWTYNSQDNAYFSGHYFEGFHDGEQARVLAYQEFTVMVRDRVERAFGKAVAL